MQVLLIGLAFYPLFFIIFAQNHPIFGIFLQLLVKKFTILQDDTFCSRRGLLFLLKILLLQL